MLSALSRESSDVINHCSVSMKCHHPVSRAKADRPRGDTLETKAKACALASDSEEGAEVTGVSEGE